MENEKRLIDVNAEIRKMKDALAKNKRNTRHLVYWVFDTVISVLEKAPTVDAVEVVHGRWEVEKEKDTFGYIIHLKCSQCNNRNSKRTNYCPNCGAKMDLEEVS